MSQNAKAVKTCIASFKELGLRAQAALTLSLLWLLALAIIGFVHTVEFWIIAFGIVLIVTLLIIGVKWYLGRLKQAKVGEYKNQAADFLFSFLRKYSASAPVALMPVFDSNELRTMAISSINKGVVIIGFRLLLATEKTYEDTGSPSRFAEWLRHYSKSYGIQNNLPERGGFPFYYAVSCEISGQHLEIKILIVESGAAVNYIKNPPQPPKSIDIFVDDDFGHENEDDMPDDWKVKLTADESLIIATDDELL